jgi:predicted transposase/invertase (TIGR01784 family)
MEASAPKYINPYTDFGFKKLFGEEGNKDLLIDFLNQLLPPKHQIAELHFKNVEAIPDTSEERKAFFDIHCMATSGERFIVEMQKARVNFFKERALFYSTFPIREQAQQGKDWLFQLEPVYFIAILDFFYDENEELAKFRRDISLKDQDCEEFFDKLHFKFLQMPAFKKAEKDLVTHFDKWCYFLKNLESFDGIPQILKEPVFEKAFKTTELARMTAAQRVAYEQSRLQHIGLRAAILTAEEIGEKKGIDKGIKEGTLNEKERTVIELHKLGMSVEQIAVVTQLPLERVQGIVVGYDARAV